jgi:hypothetical protein
MLVIESRESENKTSVHAEEQLEVSEPPPVGTELEWSGNSLFNNDSLYYVLFWDCRHPDDTQPRPPRPLKRPFLPLLQLTWDNDADPPRPLYGPPPGRTLRLDILLGENCEIYSQTWMATVLPDDLPVCVKLFTDQWDKRPAEQYISQEEYEETNWGMLNGGENAQKAICREADRYEAMSLLQGEYVPYSYGQYQVRD